MPRYDRGDILMELIELCRDIKSEIHQQLTYYRVSVYKAETAEQIEVKVKQLEVLAGLLGDEQLIDAFSDYDLMKKNGYKTLVPGECFLSHRLANLFQSIELMFEVMIMDIRQANQEDKYKLTKSVLIHRDQVLSICRHGSRQWEFFNGI
ncbi:MAG: hypothetical protein EOP04_32840 [Proteobacteria bacterium]|nr:MAG: hypothetical protein EOP04_32840 [Pseudomonadota bacterium]